MYDDLLELIEKLKEKKDLYVDDIPIRVIEGLRKFDEEEIGSLILDLRSEGYEFPKSPQVVIEQSDLIDLIINSQNKGEQMLYMIKLLGMFNRIASKGAEKLIGILTV